MSNNDQAIELICQFLNERLGFTYNLQKKHLIIARLNKRLAELQLTDFQAYLSLIKSDANELSYFFDLITTNVTSFFREDSQFRILQHEILPSLVELANGTYKLRCWSAGCSSGEEAYSLAIVLKEALGDHWDVKVLASDISTRKLKEGMAGVYSDEKLKDVLAHRRAKYFQPVSKEKGRFQVIPELRRQIVFRKINLNQDFAIPAQIKFDLILCRNVFIYLAKEARERVLDGFHSLLKEGGYFIVGQSEPLNTYIDLRWRAIKNSIYQKKQFT